MSALVCFLIPNQSLGIDCSWMNEAVRFPRKPVLTLPGPLMLLNVFCFVTYVIGGIFMKKELCGIFKSLRAGSEAFPLNTHASAEAWGCGAEHCCSNPWQTLNKLLMWLLTSFSMHML